MEKEIKDIVRQQDVDDLIFEDSDITVSER